MMGRVWPIVFGANTHYSIWLYYTCGHNGRLPSFKCQSSSAPFFASRVYGTYLLTMHASQQWHWWLQHCAHHRQDARPTHRERPQIQFSRYSISPDLETSTLPETKHCSALNFEAIPVILFLDYACTIYTPNAIIKSQLIGDFSTKNGSFLVKNDIFHVKFFSWGFNMKENLRKIHSNNVYMFPLAYGKFKSESWRISQAKSRKWYRCGYTKWPYQVS
jgi:hypothetical protein